MNPYIHRIRQFAKFYRAAQTKYQIHSPFVFELVNAVLEDDRHFYAFSDVERVRAEMLKSDAYLEITDFGAGMGGDHADKLGIHVHTRVAPLRQVVRMAGSSVRQSRRLFRMIQFLKPKRMLELGTSVGVGAMYMASAAREATFFTLEGCENCAKIAEINLETLKLNHVEVVPGVFEITLVPVLERLKKVDFVFFDGNHRREPTLRYFEICKRYAHEKTAFIFDDIHWSADMTSAWEGIKNDPDVTLTVDFFDMAMVFFNPDFREKQHFQVVPSKWKRWKIF